jgi:hypothetical protein
MNAIENVLRGTEKGCATRIVENVGPVCRKLGFVQGNNGRIERIRGSSNGGPFPSIVGNNAHFRVLLDTFIMEEDNVLAQV